MPLADAGGSVQCTACGRLRSIPELDELDAMEEDGTIRLTDGAASDLPHTREGAAGGAAAQRPPRPVKLPGLVDYPRFTDPSGIDRRASLEAILGVGAPRAEPEPARRERYDPETGELVTDLELAEPGAWTAPAHAPGPRDEAAEDGAEPSDVAPAPHNAHGLQELRREQPSQRPPPPTLAYANTRENYVQPGRGYKPIPLHIRPVHWYSIPLELFQPQNVLVLGFVLAMHLLVQGMVLLSLVGALPLLLLAGLIVLAIVAHYAIILDETGPEKRDEIPGVLRNVSISDDFLRPIWAVLTALALCFGPAAALGRAGGWAGAPDGPTLAAALIALVLGTILFPATLLTAATSGTFLNLAPHRVLGVLLAAPGKYFLGVLLFLVSVALYVVAFSALGYLTFAAAGAFALTGAQYFLAAVVGYFALMAAVYVAHAFCWLLGKIHQEHHDDFGWVLQRHISTRNDPTKQLERQKLARIMAERDEQARRAAEQVQAGFAARP